MIYDEIYVIYKESFGSQSYVETQKLFFIWPQTNRENNLNSAFFEAFIINDEVAIEVKGKENITDKDLAGLKALSEEKILKKFFLISLVSRPRKIGNISVLPWKTFLEMLWADEVMI